MEQVDDEESEERDKTHDRMLEREIGEQKWADFA
jgi:hypothetical protein